MEIELVGLDAEDVARRSGRQNIRRQCLAKAGDVDPQRRRATLERVLAPHVVDQAIGGNDLVGAEEEGGEEGARLRPAEGNLAAPVPHLERP